MIKWLFFDLGSTLIDESACDMFRLRHMLSQPGAPERHILEAKMREYSQNGLHPYKSALKEFNLEACPWPAELEKPYPGVPELLDALSRRYYLGVIANQIPGTENRLQKYGIRCYFNVIIASAEAGIAKPDPEIFLMALEKAGCRADEAMMIGDRIDNDILPAARLGMHTIWVKQGMHRLADTSKLEILPEYTVAGICELTDILL